MGFISNTIPTTKIKIAPAKIKIAPARLTFHCSKPLSFKSNTF